MSDVRKPVKTDFRFSARVDYFATAPDALTYAQEKREQGYNVNGGASLIAEAITAGEYQGLYGVHWIDRKGEGFYG